MARIDPAPAAFLSERVFLWYADPLVTSMIRERAWAFARDPEKCGKSGVEYACAVVDAMHSRLVMLSSPTAGILSRRSEKGSSGGPIKTIDWSKLMAPTIPASATERASLRKTAALARLWIAVELACREPDPDPWLSKMVDRVAKELDIRSVPKRVTGSQTATQRLPIPTTNQEPVLLPQWLCGHSLPKHVCDPVEDVFRDPTLPASQAVLWAIVKLCHTAEGGILDVRRDHEANPKSLNPSRFVIQVFHLLRDGRDDLLAQLQPEYVSVASARLEKLLDATSATLEAFMSKPLGSILCPEGSVGVDNTRLLPGPWMAAMEQSWKASTDVYRLSQLIDDWSRSRPRAPQQMHSQGEKALPSGASNSDSGEDDQAEAALTQSQIHVLQTMARFDALRLLSSKKVAEEMDAPIRLSEETVRICVGKLIRSNLAERPEGDRSGARLNNAGRRLAAKIAD